MRDIITGRRNILLLYLVTLLLGVFIATLGSNVALGILFIASSLIGIVSTLASGTPWLSIILGVCVLVAIPVMAVGFAVRAMREDLIYLLPALICLSVSAVLIAIAYQRFPRKLGRDTETPETPGNAGPVSP